MVFSVWFTEEDGEGENGGNEEQMGEFMGVVLGV